MGWGASTSTAENTLSIVKLTPVDGDSSALTPVECADITFTGGGNNNIPVALTGSFPEVTIASGDILMPMIKVASFEEAVGSYFNLTFTLY